MYLRRCCDALRCKTSLLNGTNMLGTYVALNKNIRLDCDGSKHEYHCVFRHLLKKSEVFICTKLQLHTSQSLYTDGEMSKKSNVEGSKKQAQDPKSTTQNQTASTHKNVKPITKPKPRNKRKTTIRIATVLLGIGTVYYFTHLVVDPITGRRKFHLYSENQNKKLGQTQSDYFKRNYKDKLETSGKKHDRVLKIVTTLMKANSDLQKGKEQTSWTVYVINDGSVNSYVLANGDIFVFSGLLEAVGSDDHLAAMFAHQIAHVLLNHSAEIPTWRLRSISMILHRLISAGGILPRFFVERLSVFIMKQNMGKKLEAEADTLSVEIVSKACYDPRKVKEFWMTVGNMRMKRRDNLLSTHPNNKSRNHRFDSLMPKAFNILHKHCTGGQHPYFK